MKDKILDYIAIIATTLFVLNLIRFVVINYPNFMIFFSIVIFVAWSVIRTVNIILSKIDENKIN